METMVITKKESKKSVYDNKFLFPLMCCLLLFLFSPTPASADIASVQAEITQINAQITALTNNELATLDAEIDELRNGMNEAREFMNTFTSRNDWLVQEYNTHRSRLRQYEGRVFQLSMSYGDFFDAKHAWENSNDPLVKREQIIIMFRYLNGNEREPGQWELDSNTQQDFVDMADLIVRRRAVARIGEALVLLGDLTLELVNGISGIPQNMKEAAFATFDFAFTATCKLLPDSALVALNNVGLSSIAYLEYQKQQAELLANQLNEIRNRDEFGGENGRLEALAKAQALVEFEQNVLARLEPEMTDYLDNKAIVEANFANVQAELNGKIEERGALYRTIHALIQNRIDKQYELTQLQEQTAIDENGGPTNYVASLSAGRTDSAIAADALTSAIMNMPRYTTLSSNAGYITTVSNTCQYSEDGHTYYETYHTKKTFTAPVGDPIWRKVDAVGDVSINGNLAYGTVEGSLSLQSVLSPAFTSESNEPSEHACPSDYRPEGSGEKTSNKIDIDVIKVQDALFLPEFYYYHEAYTNSLDGIELFNAIKDAADNYGGGIDLFIGGKVQQWDSSGIYYIVNRYGEISFEYLDEPEMKPTGNQQLFEINNQMKVLGEGSVTLYPVLFETDGTELVDGAVNSITVTGNKVKATVTANNTPGLTPEEDSLVVINEPAQFTVAIQGPADMGNYEVKWRYFIYQDTGYPTGWLEFDRHDGKAVTSFSGPSSNNPVTLNDPADFNRKLKVEFDICRKYDSVVVYSGVFDRVKSIIKGNRFFLANSTTHEIYMGNRFFLFRGLSTLSPSIGSQNLELRLDLGDNQSVAVPFSDTIQGLLFGTEAAEALKLGTTKVYDTYIYTSLSTIAAAGRIELGLYNIREADAESLLSNMGIVVESTRASAMTSIDINLFRVNYRETTLGPMYVIKGYAPTPLDSFRARWTFFDGTTTETPFNYVGLIQESLTPMNKGLKQVQIINTQGIPVAQAGFLSASTSVNPDKVGREIRTVYKITTEYRYNESKQGYRGLLTSLSKHGSYDMFELGFQFPPEFPLLEVKTVNDISNAPLPVVSNVAVDTQGIAFDTILPDAGHLTRLTMLNAPAHGSLAVEGIHTVYTPKSGFNDIDRFILRIDGTKYDIEPDAIYYNLEVKVDCSDTRPVLTFTQVFTPFYLYGPYALGITFMDTNGEIPTTSIVTPPEAAEQLIVEVLTGVVGIKTSSLPGNTEHSFTIGLTMPGGSTGDVDVSLFYNNASYPEFYAFRNRDFVIPPMLILHRFFELYENGPLYIKNIWADLSSGELLLNGEPLGTKNQISLTDLNNLIFRPKTDYTGPTVIHLYGSEDGETWSSQIHIGGFVLDLNGNPELTKAIWILQVMAGLNVSPPEQLASEYISSSEKIDIAEAIRLLQKTADLE